MVASKFNTLTPRYVYIHLMDNSDKENNLVPTVIAVIIFFIFMILGCCIYWIVRRCRTEKSSYNPNEELLRGAQLYKMKNSEFYV
uniref:Uncharacterized protein n=1 Tax=Strongyloides stercoralis TaxID=6248 RepID=A0A0K0E5J1_STRER